MTDDDDLPTAEELAEAEALARALEPPASGQTAAPPASGGGTPAPADALATAALLRYARDTARGEAPGRARVAAAADRVRPGLDARLDARPRRRRWLMSAALAAPAAAAIALAYLTVRSTDERAAAPPPSLPAPTVGLLERQARAARGREGLAALDAQMREYRAAFYAELAARGGGR